MASVGIMGGPMGGPLKPLKHVGTFKYNDIYIKIIYIQYIVLLLSGRKEKSGKEKDETSNNSCNKKSLRVKIPEANSQTAGSLKKIKKRK